MYDQSNETFLLTRYQLYCSYYETLTHNDNGSSVESDRSILRTILSIHAGTGSLFPL